MLPCSEYAFEPFAHKQHLQMKKSAVDDSKRIQSTLACIVGAYKSFVHAGHAQVHMLSMRVCSTNLFILNKSIYRSLMTNPIGAIIFFLFWPSYEKMLCIIVCLAFLIFVRKLNKPKWYEYLV